MNLDDLPEAARAAWMRLSDELHAMLGDDLVAVWAYGSTIGSDRPHRPADLDTHVIVRRKPDVRTAQAIDSTCEAIAAGAGTDLDIWALDHLPERWHPAIRAAFGRRRAAGCSDGALHRHGHRERLPATDEARRLEAF